MADLLRTVSGAKPVTISALTDTRARKTGNPYSEVLKLTHVNGFVNVDYSASVERQQTKDGQPVGFEARPHKWGDRVGNTPLRQHRENGKLYLTIQPKRILDKQVFFGRNPTSGALVSVPKSVIAPFLPEKRSAAPSQGVEHEVVTRDYSLENITAITLNGQAYRVRADGAPQAPQVKPSAPGKTAGQVYLDTVKAKGKRSFMASASVKPLGTDGPIGEEHCQPEGWDGHKSEQ